jgi:hypothetical protein
MCQRRTARRSVNATSRRVPSGDHQYPRARPISSAAMNSASPQARSGPSGSASAWSFVPSTPTTRSASFAT